MVHRIDPRGYYLLPTSSNIFQPIIWKGNNLKIMKNCEKMSCLSLEWSNYKKTAALTRQQVSASDHEAMKGSPWCFALQI